MNKGRALFYSIILFTLGIVEFIIEMACLNKMPDDAKWIIGVICVGTLLLGFILLFDYMRLKKKEEQYLDRYAVDDLPSYDEEEFLQWLQNFEPFVRMGAKLTETPQETFTKFGGLPLVPENFVWPTRGGDCIPFLLQIDFSEINPDGKLSEFPTQGRLYLFVDNDLMFDPYEEGYAQGRTFQIRFFEKPDKLTVATKPDSLDTVYKEFCVSSNITKTYPDVDDCEEAFYIYYNRPCGGSDDGYNELQGENLDVSMIGGWATYVQSSSFIGDGNFHPDEWVLLMQIASVPDDEEFMWGDSGMLYFFIRKEDLLARKFDNVKLDMQCY